MSAEAEETPEVKGRAPARISFTSDGTREGSAVSMDGEIIRGVHKVEFSMDVKGKPELVLYVRPRYVELNLPGSALVMREEDDEEEDYRR